MDNVLIVRDPRGFAVTWGDDEVQPTDEQVLEKQEYMVKWLRELGFEVQRAVQITGPTYLEIEQRAQLLCELWFDCEGKPTMEQWQMAHDDLWNGWCLYCAETGKEPGERPLLPPLPHSTPKLGVIEGGRAEEDWECPECGAWYSGDERCPCVGGKD